MVDLELLLPNILNFFCFKISGQLLRWKEIIITAAVTCNSTAVIL